MSEIKEAWVRIDAKYWILQTDRLSGKEKGWLISLVIYHAVYGKLPKDRKAITWIADVAPSEYHEFQKSYEKSLVPILQQINESKKEAKRKQNDCKSFATAFQKLSR